MTDRKDKVERDGVELSEQDLGAANGGALQIFVKTLKLEPLPESADTAEFSAREASPEPGALGGRAPDPSGQGFGQRIICVQRNWAIGFPAPSVVTTASQTWVERPLCSGVATQLMVPSSAVPRKLLLSSMVVKPAAPSGRLRTVP